MRIALLLAIVTLAGPAGLGGQERELRGRILPGQADVPWAGAAIEVLETGRVVCADGSGRFQFLLPSGEEVRLSVRPVGFPATVLTAVPADDEVLLTLATHVFHLDGVVVTAYAESLPPGLPYGSSVVQGRELGRVPGSLPGTLAGRAPGANVLQNSGAPGGSFQLAIRGVRTILGNAEPLIVVDGVPVGDVAPGTGTSFLTGSTPAEEERGRRLADLDALDIAHVEIVKGVAASQRFGPRAANGVVSITTRRGRVADSEPEPDFSLACYRPAG